MVLLVGIAMDPIRHAVRPKGSIILGQGWPQLPDLDVPALEGWVKGIFKKDFKLNPLSETLFVYCIQEMQLKQKD